MKINSVLYMPDGNRRFAKAHGLTLREAYYRGGKVLEILSRFFLGRGLADTLIFHALSSYTHNRTDESLGAIYRAIIELFGEWEANHFFSGSGINIHIVNHIKNLPEDLAEACIRLTGQNQAGLGKEVFILLGYSLSEDINSALSAKPNDYAEFRRGLLFSDIDLVIRTMEMRASGGPAYAMSQSQMMTLNKTNPEVTTADLDGLWKKYCELLEYRMNTRSIAK